MVDEVNMDQVVTFRELFQTNHYVQQFGTSVCNPYASTTRVYYTAMIVCTDNFNVNEGR